MMLMIVHYEYLKLNPHQEQKTTSNLQNHQYFNHHDHSHFVIIILLLVIIMLLIILQVYSENPILYEFIIVIVPIIHILRVSDNKFAKFIIFLKETEHPLNLLEMYKCNSIHYLCPIVPKLMDYL